MGAGFAALLRTYRLLVERCVLFSWSRKETALIFLQRHDYGNIGKEAFRGQRKKVTCLFSILQKLGWFFKKHWIRYTVAITLLIVAGIAEIIPPKILGYAVDEIHMGSITADRLIAMISWTLGITVLIYLMTYVWMYQLFGGAFLVERVLRSRFMRHLLKMTPTFSKSTGRAI